MSKLDTESLAKQDIIARPEVTGSGENGAENSANMPPKAPETAPEPQSMEPDALERSAGKLIAKTFDEFKKNGGGDSDPDMQRLVTEVMGGMFGAMRSASGAPWMRFVVAGGALAFSFIPAGMAFYSAKNAKKKEGEKNDGSL